MRLKATIIGALSCAAVLGLAGPATPAKPAHGVVVGACNKLDRSAAFVGKMRGVQDTERMWMRFALLERALPAEGFQAVVVPGLDVWHKSRPGVKRFSFRQHVRALSEAAIYRAAVEFRWYDEEGELIRQTVQRSRRCRQPGTLPNLHVKRIGRRPSGQYFVRVGNDGHDMATGASVQLFVDGQDAGTVDLPDIAPDAVAAAPFDGPDCVGSVQAVVDPTASVRESVEDDNARTAPCAELSPAASGQ